MAKRITVEDIWEIFPNKYEAIVVASRYARELAKNKEKVKKLNRKPVIIALEKLVRGEIKYRHKKQKKQSA